MIFKRSSLLKMDLGSGILGYSLSATGVKMIPNKKEHDYWRSGLLSQNATLNNA